MATILMQIIPRGSERATVISYDKEIRNVREMLQNVAYSIHVAMNEEPNVLLIYSKDSSSKILVCDDAIIHGYRNTNELLEFICRLARGTVNCCKLN